MRAQKSDLCLRYCVHHQRYAHRSQSNAPQRNEVRRDTDSTQDNLNQNMLLLVSLNIEAAD